jgi:hypothetical protein
MSERAGHGGEMNEPIRKTEADWAWEMIRDHVKDLLREVNQRYDHQFESMKVMIDEKDKQFTRQFESLKALLQEKDKRDEQRFIAQESAVQAALLAQKEAVATALLSADRAVSKAEMAAEKRFEGMNEFRQALSDQNSTFLPRAEGESQFKNLNDKFSAQFTGIIDQYRKFDSFMSSQQGMRMQAAEGSQHSMWMFGLIFTIVALFGSAIVAAVISYALLHR